VTGVPGEFLEDLRKAIRKHLRQKGWRSQTMVGSGVLHVMSADALEAIEPTVRAAWIDQAIRRMGVVEQPTDDEAIVDQPRLGVAWQTWVLDE
jgi:hypothetical protein